MNELDALNESDVQDPLAREETGVMRPISAPTTAIEGLGAAAELGLESTPTASIMKLLEQNEAEAQGGALVDAKTLNERYPNLAEPFREPQTEAVAKLLANRQYYRQELAAKVANGPDSNFYHISKYGAMMLPHALDPINVGAGLALSFATPLVFAGTRVGAAMGVARGAAGAAEATAGQLFVRNVAEGVAGSVLTEPLIAYSMYKEDREYDTSDMFLNTVGGALAFPSVVYGIKGVKYAGSFAINKGAQFLSRVSPKLAEVAQRNAIARMLNGQRPRTDIFTTQAVREIDVDIKPDQAGGGKYLYEKIDPMPGKRVYASSMDFEADVNAARTEVIDGYWGEGVYLSDNSGLVNANAGRLIKDTAGEVIEFEINSNLRLLELDQKLPDDVRAIAKEVYGKDFDGSARELLDGDLDGSKFDAFNEKLKVAGYDGYVSDGTNVAGETRNPHNSMMIFNKEKLTPVNRFKAEMDKVGRPDQATLAELHEKAKKPQYSELIDDTDPEVYVKELDELTRPTEAEVDLVKRIEAEEDELIAELDEVEKLGLLDPEDIKLLEDFKAAKKDQANFDELYKGAVMCLLRLTNG